MKKFVASVSRFLISNRSSSSSSNERDHIFVFRACVYIWVDFVAIHTNVIFMIIHEWLLVVFSFSKFVIKFRYSFYHFVLHSIEIEIEFGCAITKKRVKSFVISLRYKTVQKIPVYQKNFASHSTGFFWLLQNQQFNTLLTHFFEGTRYTLFVFRILSK